MEQNITSRIVPNGVMRGVVLYICLAMTDLRCVSEIGNLSTDFIEKLQSKGYGTIPKQKMPVMEREEIFKTSLPVHGYMTAKEYL